LAASAGIFRNCLLRRRLLRLLRVVVEASRSAREESSTGLLAVPKQWLVALPFLSQLVSMPLGLVLPKLSAATRTPCLEAEVGTPMLLPRR
jgi:hypothetical protein